MLNLLAFFLTCLLFCFVSLASCASQRSSQGVQTPHRNQIRELRPSSQFFSKAWTEHNIPFCFLLEHHNTCVRSHPPWRDSPVLSIFSTSLNKPSSCDCSSRPRSTGLQWVLFNFTATAPKHLTFQGVIFCSSYLTTLHH